MIKCYKNGKMWYLTDGVKKEVMVENYFIAPNAVDSTPSGEPGVSVDYLDKRSDLISLLMPDETSSYYKSESELDFLYYNLKKEDSSCIKESKYDKSLVLSKLDGIPQGQLTPLEDGIYNSKLRDIELSLIVKSY